MVRPRQMATWGYWGIWLLVGLYFSALDAASFGHDLPVLRRILILDISQHLFWGLLVLGLLKLLNRYPLGSLREWRPWALYLGLSLALTFSGLLFLWTLISALGGPITPVQGHSFWQKFWFFHWKYFHADWVNFLVAIGAWGAYDLYRRYRQRELESARLAMELSRAQHHALRMQLQPHFLFNALNTINSLIRANPADAERMVARLGDLLRLTLEQGDPQEVTLHQELALLEAYLEIQRLRFGPRLEIEISCPDALRTALVPNLLLQPLVENAFKHGLGAPRKHSWISIRIRSLKEQLILEVEDNGQGLGPGHLREGIGTSNTRNRLAMLYADRYRFQLMPASSGGTKACIELPLHWVPVEPEPPAWFETTEHKGGSQDKPDWSPRPAL
jgi:two-component system LytT family sensor kinase